GHDRGVDGRCDDAAGRRSQPAQRRQGGKSRLHTLRHRRQRADAGAVAAPADRSPRLEWRAGRSRRIGDARSGLPAEVRSDMARILLLVELKGGNDGLNTVIPYADPLYRELRPDIGLARERVLQLDERVGLHARLEPLITAWQARDLAIVQGVGYPDPSRSHFRSIEIWDTASSSGKTLSEGWVARAFEHAALPKGAGVDSIAIDTNARPLMGPDLRTVVMQDAETFLRQTQALRSEPVDNGGNPALRHLLAVQREVNAAAADLRDELQAAPNP